MTDPNNLFAVARIQNYSAPEPERVQFARIVCILPDGHTDLEWCDIEDAEGLSPSDAAAVLDDCEQQEDDGFRSPRCIVPDECHLLNFEDVRRLAARRDLSPELLRDETRRLSFPRDDRGTALFAAADSILNGRPAIDPRPLSPEEEEAVFGIVVDDSHNDEEDETDDFPEDQAARMDARVLVDAPEALVVRLASGRYLFLDHLRALRWGSLSAYAVFRKFAPLVQAALDR